MLVPVCMLTAQSRPCCVTGRGGGNTLFSLIVSLCPPVRAGGCPQGLCEGHLQGRRLTVKPEVCLKAEKKPGFS